LRDKKGTVYEGGIRTCTFITWPGQISGGRTINEPLHIVDWYPTLVKLAGGSLTQNLPLDGLDIWPVLSRGAKSPHKSLLVWGIKPNSIAIRSGKWKLVYNNNGYQLFNLNKDISETNNLATTNVKKLKEMQTRLNSLMKNAIPYREEWW